MLYFIIIILYIHNYVYSHLIISANGGKIGILLCKSDAQTLAAVSSARWDDRSCRYEECRILTVKETAVLLKTTRQQVRKMIANEELPAVKVGREWRVLKAGIVKFFEAHL